MKKQYISPKIDRVEIGFARILCTSGTQKTIELSGGDGEDDDNDDYASHDFDVL